MSRLIQTLCVMLVATLSLALGADQPRKVQWSSKDIKGTSVSVPSDKPTVLAFIRADQEQTRDVLTAIRKTMRDSKTGQVVLVFSGPMAEKQAQDQSADNPQNWPIVADPDFSASGTMNIHVWPTTLVVNPAGEEVAHLAGSTRNLIVELDAYSALAAGQIDKAALEKRLTTKEVVVDGPRERAARHLRMAQQFLLQQRTSQAKAEVEKAIALQPDDAVIKLALSKVQVAEGKPLDGLKTVEAIPAEATSPWRIGVARLRALIALERWDEARNLAGEVTKLNPEPAEAFYLSGQVWAHAQDWPKAAESFRAAYEATQSAKP